MYNKISLKKIIIQFAQIYNLHLNIIILNYQFNTVFINLSASNNLSDMYHINFKSNYFFLLFLHTFFRRSTYTKIFKLKNRNNKIVIRYKQFSRIYKLI